MALCECGCGGEAKPGRRFIHGHNSKGKNNPMYGKHQTEESKQKSREAQLGRKHTKETKQKISDAQLGENNHFYGKHHTEKTKVLISNEKKEYFQTEEGQQWLDENIRGVNNPMYGVSLIPWNKGLTKETNESIRAMAEEKLILFRDKNNHPMYGRHLTESSKQEISKTRKEFFQTEEGQEWLDKFMRGENSSRYGKGAWNKGLDKETDDRVKKIAENTSKGLKEFYQTEEGKKSIEEISKAKKAFFATEEGQEWLDDNLRGENNGMYGKHHTDETREKMHNAHIGIQFSEDHRRKILKAVCVSPNKKEQYLYWILQVIFPKEYKFVGDGTVIIGRYCPDFININGQKKLIELFGDYWHMGDDEGNRIFQFRLFGFDTLVIWEHELNDNEIEMTIAKIIEFHLR